MPSESHVYDLFDLEGKRIGVCMPSRNERKTDLMLFGDRFFKAQRDRTGGILRYDEVGHGEFVTIKGPYLSVAEPKVVIYGR